MSGMRFADGAQFTLADLAGWLRASLLPGTARPHRTAQGMSPARRAVVDAQARAERLERTDVALGEHAAPMHLDVLDLLDEVDDPGAVWSDTELESWCLRALSVLGMLPDGQLLDALCPWCDGRSDGWPAGGGRTLRVRVLGDGRPAVVCEGGLCEPPGSDVGAWWRGLPAWPIEAEGAWLAGRIEHADAARGLAAAAVSGMLASELAADGCGVCGAPPVRGEAGACSSGHRKVLERRSQRARRRGEAA